jgi:hypothetical protein
MASRRAMDHIASVNLSILKTGVSLLQFKGDTGKVCPDSTFSISTSSVGLKLALRAGG